NKDGDIDADLGFHILTDEQLTKKLQGARDLERGWSNRIIVRLLGNNTPRVPEILHHLKDKNAYFELPVKCHTS
ncbi:unnamed protein product, partial [marine sediment metagenome]